MRAIDRVFNRLGFSSMPGWGAIRGLIDRASVAAFPNVKAKWAAHGGAAGAVIAAAAVYELYKAGNIGEKWNEAKAMASDGLTGLMYNWMEDVTGVRPEGLTKQKLEEWAAKLVALEINAKAGTDFASVIPAQAFVDSVKAKVLAEIKAGGRAGQLPIARPYAESLQLTIAQAYNKAMKVPILGAALSLAQDQKKLKNRIRQKRWRERNRQHWSYWNKSPEHNAILIAERRAYNAAVGKPQDAGIPAGVLGG